MRSSYTGLRWLRLHTARTRTRFTRLVIWLHLFGFDFARSVYGFVCYLLHPHTHAFVPVLLYLYVVYVWLLVAFIWLLVTHTRSFYLLRLPCGCLRLHTVGYGYALRLRLRFLRYVALRCTFVLRILHGWLRYVRTRGCVLVTLVQFFARYLYLTLPLPCVQLRYVLFTLVLRSHTRLRSPTFTFYVLPFVVTFGYALAVVTFVYVLHVFDFAFTVVAHALAVRSFWLSSFLLVVTLHVPVHVWLRCDTCLAVTQF